MKPAPFEYHSPTSIEACLALLAEYNEEASLLAGGQSLLPLMRFRLAQPNQVITIRGIGGELRSIRIEDGHLVIGAGVTYAEVQRSAEAHTACPGLSSAIALIATPAIRNRGTVCGNLCQADPASELPAVALIMQAQMRLRSRAGKRIVAAQDFFLGPYTTARRGDEMLTEVAFPIRSPDESFAIREVTRLRGGFPMAGVAVSLTRGPGTALRAAAVACFGVNAVQIRAPAAETALTEFGYSPQGVSVAADALDEAIEPHADPFASAEYRRSAARALLREALDEACGSQKGRS
jgi:aerobic carbon-monoxide dehydrogenase medium subunit